MPKGYGEKQSEKQIISCAASTCAGCDEDKVPCKAWRWEAIYGTKNKHMETRGRVYRCPHCLSLSDEQYDRCPVCHKYLNHC